MMNAKEFFEQARQVNAVPQDADLNDAWAFGVNASDLAKLVLRGVKTATSSGFEIYDVTHESLPKAGTYDVLLDDDHKPVCIILIDTVEVVPFSHVSAEHAFKEGEGDRALLSWQINHAKFFHQDYKKHKLVFNRHTSHVVLETFHVVFPTK